MRLSLRAAIETASICKEIINHPFNHGMRNGDLHSEKFSYYSEQDLLYLRELKCRYTTLAAKAPPQYRGDFLNYADSTLICEQEMLQFLEKTFSFNKTGFIAPATLGYINHLLHNCTNEPFEVAVASLLPCFTVYRDIGLSFRHNPSANNPYAPWNEAYSCKDFSDSVNRAVEIFDELADNANEATRQKMLKVYGVSCRFEWRFFDDAYHQRRHYILKDLRDLSLTPNQTVQKPDAAKLASSFALKL
jgi:thiaminase/transcriptional activator TenA